MSKPEITEREIEAAQELSARRNFEASLARYQEMLGRAQDQQILYRALNGIVTCSTWLNRAEVLTDAMERLKKLPDYELSVAFAAMNEADFLYESGHPQEALDLIAQNLASEALQREDFLDWKYDQLFLRGRCLVKLVRCQEALVAFDLARAIESDGKNETDMLIDRSNCLMALDRFDEAYDLASRVLDRDDVELTTLALQYMAECRLWQGRAHEALELYATLQKRLPSKFVDEERIQKGISSAITHLEKGHPERKPN